jgi:NAD(P)H-flavin reductase
MHILLNNPKIDVGDTMEFQEEYQILKKETLAPNLHLMVLDAKMIARKAKAGNFIIIRTFEHSERIPLTIADYGREKGTITIIFQEVGKSTKELAKLKEGDSIKDVVGPLGHPAEVENVGTVVCVGGGVGIAPLYPDARAFKEAGNKVISIIGARNKELLFWEEEMRDVSDDLHVTTDDGSYGRKGFVSDVLREILDSDEKVDLVIAIGPVIMMKVVSNLTKEYGVKTIVSLNPIMIDGTGMCGGCRVMVEGNKKFACVDGPEFDGHQVDFDLLGRRLRTYVDEEKCACERYLEGE